MNSTNSTNSNKMNESNVQCKETSSVGFLSDLKQLNLLIWKNYSLQKRSIIGSLLEILIPALFAVILLPIRTIVQSDQILNDTRYDSFTFNALPDKLVPFDAKNWIFGYQPNSSDLANSIMRDVAQSLNLDMRGFENEKTMVDYLTDPLVYRYALGGASFTSLDPKSISYKLRFSYSPKNIGQANLFGGDWKTQFIFNLFPILGPREKGSNDGGDPGYYREGFLALQKAIDIALISQFDSNVKSVVDLKLKRFPFPPYNDDKFVAAIVAVFPLIIIISFIFTVILTAKQIVHEKETGLKEAMKLMGMKPWVYWLSWYIKTFLMLLPALLFMIISYKIKLEVKGGAVAAIVDKTDAFLFALFLILYSSCAITFTFMWTTLFKKANSAAAGVGIIFFLTYVPYIFISLRYSKMSMLEKVLPLFLCNLAMSEGLQLIGMFEGKGIGINFSNWTQGVSVDDQLSFIIIMAFLFFLNFVHLALMYYFEQVMPGDYGIAKPWHFPFSSLKNYLARKTNSNLTNRTSDEKLFDQIAFNSLPIYIEDEISYANRGVGIKIKNLSKTFKQLGVLKQAVNDLSLNIYEGQITVLLGHNGAGKSTTISMITGLIEPTQGNIFINDVDIVQHTTKARKFIGLCPQHNLLFDDLTVYEHLKFFSRLKESFSEQEIDKMLDIINLKDKKNALSKTLSGGMKRKLSIAIAFIGNSSIVVLDEPTSGMDVQARHSTWSLLQKFKREKKCTILLTTHFMDEADVLGDRIAIMSQGKLRCCGSSAYLKSKYGSGYNLTLTKKKSDQEKVEHDSSNKIIELIKSHISNASLHSNINSEISFILPIEETAQFSALFESLEAKKESLDILNVGISITTLEDVFLRLDENDHAIEAASSSSSKQTLNPAHVELNSLNQSNNDAFIDCGLWIGSKNDELVSGLALVGQQFYALLVKRFIHSLRNKSLIIAQLIIPLVILFFYLIYIKFAPIKAEDSPPLVMSLSKYGNNYATYKLNDEKSDVLQLLSKSYGLKVDMNKNSKSFPIESTNIVQMCSDKRQNVEDFISCIGRISFNLVIDNYIIAADFNQVDDKLELIGYFNNQPFHVPSLSLNYLTNSLYNFYTNSTDRLITVLNHPLPRNLNEQLNDLKLKNTSGFNLVSGLSIGFSFLIASFAVFLIKEKTSNSKHLQYLSGCNSYVFWLSTFLWDMLNYMITAACVLLLLKAFNIDKFVANEKWTYVLGLLVLYGFAHIPQSYLFSYIFKVPATGFSMLVGFYLISSQATLIPVQVLSLPQLDLVDVSKILEWIFLIIFPNFSLSEGLKDMYDNSEINEFCSNKGFYKLCSIFPNPCCRDYGTSPNRCGISTACLDWSKDYLTWKKPGLMRFFTFMPLQFFIQFGLVLMYEAGYFRRLSYSLKTLFKNKNEPSGMKIERSQADIEREIGDIRKDSYVIEEENRISNLIESGKYFTNMEKSEIFIVDRLTKYYSSFMAVKGISFCLQPNDTFGLLGVNGAGKTTTFKMITGEEFITKGDVFLNKTSLKNDIKKFQQQIGYCPQFDPLIDQMTVLETMRMFANLRGIRPGLIEKTCLSLTHLLDLDDHLNKMCFTLSGGNKRKLSVAIALVGSPSVVLLDEPTSGMDPGTRRTLWNCLNSIRNKGKSLILTTHSMDETEALCTKIGIMVNGELKTLGSLQTLKSKYGEGYTLLVKLGLHFDENQQEKIKKINSFIELVLNKFQNTEIKENRDGFLNIHMRDRSTFILSKIFSFVEEYKREYSIEYYVVTQTNLEQIFLNFASKQIDPETRVLKT